MNLRRLFGFMVLTFAGCSSESDSHEWQCLTDCSSSVTFALPRPLSGTDMSIIVGEPDGTVQRLDCMASGGSLACLPLSSALVPNFDPNGALRSITLDQPAAGAYTVQLLVGGASMGGGTFRYDATPLPAGPCGEVCPASQSFTIGS